MGESMAWEMMEMGLDEHMAPDGQEWEHSVYKRPSINKEVYGNNHEDGSTYGKISLDPHRSPDDNYIDPTIDKYNSPTADSKCFPDFQSATNWAKANIGRTITRSPNGNGFIVKK